jgi:hypothetical protein
MPKGIGYGKKKPKKSPRKPKKVAKAKSTKLINGAKKFTMKG